jgi:hypothetical protein
MLVNYLELLPPLLFKLLLPNPVSVCLLLSFVVLSFSQVGTLSKSAAELNLQLDCYLDCFLVLDLPDAALGNSLLLVS